MEIWYFKFVQGLELLTWMIWFALEHLTICGCEDRWKAGMGAPPRGEGGVPRPAPHCGEGGFPAPTRPVKMIKTAGKLRGKIKAYI